MLSSTIPELNKANVIKAGVINHYARRNRAQFVVCNELTFSSQNKIADLIFCKGRTTTAIEIKASNDDFRKLATQLSMYCKVFKYVYVALTSKHIEKMDSIPENVGVILFSDEGRLTYARRAKRNCIEVNEILSSLPISFIRQHSSHKKYTRQLNHTIKPQEACSIFIAYLHSRRRWASDDLKSTLHHEDITRNTDYISF